MHRTAFEAARVDIYETESTADTPDIQIPDDDIQSLEISEKLQDRIDSAKITLSATSPKYTKEGAITSGDRLHFYAGEDDSVGRAYGSGVYGEGTYSGSAPRWVGIVRNRTPKREHANKWTLELDVEDWVFGKLNDVDIRNVWRNTPVATDPSQTVANRGIVNQVLDEVPGVKPNGVEPVDVGTDYYTSGKSALDVLVDLLALGDSAMYADGQTVVFKPLSEITPSFSPSPSDMLTYGCRITADDLITNVVVHGGTEPAPSKTAKQLTRDSSATVTDTNRITMPIVVEKSQLDQIDVWTRPLDSSEDSLTLRLQRDDNGQPIDVGNTDADINGGKKQLSHEFLEHDGWTTFIFPDHTLPGGTIWLILESDGETGQRIGVNSVNGEPAIQGYYPYPVGVEKSNPEAERKYGRRDASLKDDTLRTFKAARQAANSKLRHSSEPTKEFRYSANSREAFGVSVGEILDVNFPDVDAVGTFIVTERTDSYENGSFGSDFVAVSTDSF